MKVFFSIFIIFTTILILDVVWLKFIIWDFFYSQIKHLSKIKNGNFDINLYYWLIVWIIMSLWIYIFVFQNDKNILSLFLYWALFGFVLYSVFDFTNLTFIKDYPLKFALVDIAWWSFLVWISSVISYKIINYFF